MLKRLFAPASNRDERSGSLTPDTLRRLKFFSHLAHDELILLANKLELCHLKEGKSLFRIGDDDPDDYFLLSGRLCVTGMDGSQRLITGGSEKAQGVLCAIRPRQFNAIAEEEVTCLVVDRLVLADLLAANPQPRTQVQAEAPAAQGDAEPGKALDFEDVLGGISTQQADAQQPATGLTAEQGGQLEESFKQDMALNRFRLVSLPEVALKVRRVLEDPDFSTEQVVTVINNDPVIAAKLIKASNSPLYMSWEPCESVSDSVLRLGVNTTRQLVMSFALKDLFRAEAPELKTVMRKVWQHTVYHAAIAWAMAKDTGAFNPEEAMTAAMLSNIGVLGICSYLENHPDINGRPELIEASIAHLRGHVGASIAERWSLSEQLVECALHSEKWQRQSQGEPDLCDLVIVAALHAYIGKAPVPRFDQVPAFRKLCAAQVMDPDRARDFLTLASVHVDEAQALLAG